MTDPTSNGTDAASAPIPPATAVGLPTTAIERTPLVVPPIVSADGLARQLAGPPPVEGGTVRVVDVRYYLDGRSGREAYEAGHIPGAVFVSLDDVLASPASPEAGRHPLPTPEVFAAGLGAAGIGDNDVVVAYDDLRGMVAGRLVWMLRILGRSAAVLDGGLDAWPGKPATGPADPPPEPVERQVLPWPGEATVDADEVADAIAAGELVIDARAAERYRGETEPIDPRAGHVPGAVNLPFPTNLDADGRFRSLDELAAGYASLGIGAATDGDEGGDGGEGGDTAPIVYCGSGVSACHHAVAMEAATGRRPRVYVGSWSQWSSDPDRPAATGDGAG
ncbi:MAG: sulfurtransferase [Actinomycetota bacterium]